MSAIKDFIKARFIPKLDAFVGASRKKEGAQCALELGNVVDSCSKALFSCDNQKEYLETLPEVLNRIGTSASDFEIDALSIPVVENFINSFNVGFFKQMGEEIARSLGVKNVPWLVERMMVGKVGLSSVNKDRWGKEHGNNYGRLMKEIFEVKFLERLRGKIQAYKNTHPGYEQAQKRASVALEEALPATPMADGLPADPSKLGM